MNPEAPEAPDLRDYLRLFWRRGWILLACVILIPVAAYEYTQRQTKVFQSSTVVQVQSGVDTSLLNSPDFNPPQTNIDLVAAIVGTSAVADEAARQLGLPRGSLRGTASAAADVDTGFLTITATGPTSKRAQEVATAFANALNATRKKEGLNRVNAAIQSVQQTLNSTPKTDAATRAALLAQMQRLQTLQKAQSQNAQVIEPAGPGAQTSPHPKRNATLALVLALLVGAGLIVLTERMDRRLRKPEDLEKLTGLPFLATIPHEAFPGEQSSAGVPEAFQTLRNSLTYFNADERLSSLVVVSGLKGEGKTTVAANLAIAYASFGKRVILVDTDLRKPDLAKRLGFDDSNGLSQVLAGTTSVQATLRDVPPFGHALRLLPAGPVPPNPSALLGSLRMASLMDELTSDADLVILDTTPLLVVSDAFPLLDKVSGVVGLARLDKTPRDAIRRMIQITASVGAQVLGLVATDGKGRLRGGYGYGYGYGYGSSAYGAKSSTPPAVASDAAQTATHAGANGAVPANEAERLSRPT
jgi:succinoglycan biosynthesis transport protein ExoP